MNCSACSNDRRIVARGLCNSCYQRWRKHGSTDRIHMPRGLCTVEGCGKPAHGKGLCGLHHQRLRKTGTTVPPKEYRPAPITEHDLYPQWVDFKRTSRARAIIPAWKDDFVAFCAGVGGVRPSKRHRLYLIDKTIPLGPGNFEWRESLVQKLPGEDKREYQKRAVKAHRAHFADDYRNSDLTYKYGLDFTVECYDAMAAAQDHKCAVCRKPETAVYKGKTKLLAVDHDHGKAHNNAVRGLLCQSCNKAIGFVYEDLAIIDAMRAYLVHYKSMG